MDQKVSQLTPESAQVRVNPLCLHDFLCLNICGSLACQGVERHEGQHAVHHVGLPLKEGLGNEVHFPCQVHVASLSEICFP